MAKRKGSRRDTDQRGRRSATPPPLGVRIPSPSPPSRHESQNNENDKIPERLIDYFLVLGRGNLINVPTADQSFSDLAYAPKQLQRFPTEDWKDTPFTPNLEIFTFPEDIKLISCFTCMEDDPDGNRIEDRVPTCFRLVTTKIDGGKQFCVALHFYEKLSSEEVIGLVEEKVEKLRSGIEILLESELGEADFSKATQLRDDKNMISVELLRLKMKAAMKAEDFETAVRFRDEKDKLQEKLISSLGKEKANFQIDTEELTLWSPKCICLISSHPQFTALEVFIKTIYHISRSPSPLPIERYLSNIMYEVPFPPQGLAKVHKKVGEVTLVLSRLPPNKLPKVDVSFRCLFWALSAQNIVAIFTAVCAERPVVFTSGSFTMLLHAAEAFRALLFPLHWEGVYMPVLPMALWDYMFAPVPFIAGFHRSCLEYMQQPEEVVFVDLDKNQVFVPSEDTIPQLEPSIHRKLLISLKHCANVFFAKGLDPMSNEYEEAQHKKERFISTLDHAYPNEEHMVPLQLWGPAPAMDDEEDLSPNTVGDGTNYYLCRLSELGPEEDVNFSAELIRRAFLRFWTKYLMSYKSYLLPEENDLGETFDTARFMDDAHPGRKAFLRALLETQMWSLFSTDAHMGLTGAAPTYVLFFDECIIEKKNRSARHKQEETPFLDDKRHEIVHTVNAVEPMRDGIEVGELFFYENSFPTLEERNFGTCRPAQDLSQIYQPKEAEKRETPPLKSRKKRKKSKKKRQQNIAELLSAGQIDSREMISKANVGGTDQGALRHELASMLNKREGVPFRSNRRKIDEPAPRFSSTKIYLPDLTDLDLETDLSSNTNSSSLIDTLSMDDSPYGCEGQDSVVKLMRNNDSPKDRSSERSSEPSSDRSSEKKKRGKRGSFFKKMGGSKKK